MSRFYNPHRSRNKYVPGDPKPFNLSRSKIDLFIDCPRCFYIDRRLGTGRPPGFPFNLNSAVDRLLKSEFDVHRAEGTRHPLQEQYGIKARPIAHEQLDEWRENFKGIQYLHRDTKFRVSGAIDDLWLDENDQFVVVDYKATSKSGAITALDQDWHSGYKRQMEVYQWLLRKNDCAVSSTGYFVYCNGRADKAAFDGKLEFDVTVIPYDGDDSWVEPTLSLIHACLQDDEIPAPGPDCDYCAYYDARGEVSNEPRNRTLPLA